MRISDWSSDVCSSDLLLVDRARRQPLRLELRGIENDANLAADPAVAIDARHAGDGEQLLGDVVVDVPAQLLDRHVGRDRREAGEIVVGRVDAADLRLENTVGQVAPDLLDRAAHILDRSEEHTSELQSLMRLSYAVFCLKKKKHSNTQLS